MSNHSVAERALGFRVGCPQRHLSSATLSPLSFLSHHYSVSSKNTASSLNPSSCPRIRFSRSSRSILHDPATSSDYRSSHLLGLSGMEVAVEAETDPVISPSPGDATTTTTASGGEAKACADCHTTKTPLWRGGPEGPKSLCNACGIRYRKRRQALGMDANAVTQDQQQQKKNAASSGKEDKKKEEEKKEAADKKEEEEDKKKKKKEEGGDKKKKVTVELRVVGFGKEMVLKQRRQMRRKKCLSEEERAAVLLMALSSGVIYAS